jgi:cytochrome d ubiquinol oxidase subunit II
MELWLPLIFVAVMGLSLLTYIVLDGHDLGIGLLLPLADDDEKDRMIATIGPFWDANETWIVLGVTILLIAFPAAYGAILSHLYFPATIMLMGLILRGVSFDFRVKAKARSRATWNRLFFAGSLIAAVAQGWMLGIYIMGLESTAVSLLFAAGIALTLPCFYIMLGCGWLFIKTAGDLQGKAIRWARLTTLPAGLGLALVSIATPIASETIAAKWFSLPEVIGLLPIPMTTVVAFSVVVWWLWHPHLVRSTHSWVVFAGLAVICLMCTLGLAYSIYPDIVIDKLSIAETAASRRPLMFTLTGVAITVPMIIVYTICIHRLFRGKAEAWDYD